MLRWKKWSNNKKKRQKSKKSVHEMQTFDHMLATQTGRLPARQLDKPPLPQQGNCEVLKLPKPKTEKSKILSVSTQNNICCKANNNNNNNNQDIINHNNPKPTKRPMPENRSSITLSPKTKKKKYERPGNSKITKVEIWKSHACPSGQLQWLFMYTINT